MVGSFRETVLVWLDTQLKADLYIRPAGPAGAGLFPSLPAGAADRVGRVPGVQAVDVFHGLEFRYQGQRATLGAGNMEIVRRFGRLRFLPGQDRNAILASLPGRDRVIVSEPFANKHRCALGRSHDARPGRTPRSRHYRGRVLRIFERSGLCYF